MDVKELRNLVESLMSNTSNTDEGISCPFCMMPQKQIISHIKKKPSQRDARALQN